MKVFIAGATGATGRLLAEDLLNRGVQVHAVVRSLDNLPDALKNHPHFTYHQASILDLKDAEIQEQVRGCDALASCLGHNLTFKGIWGKPRRLVAQAVQRLCNAVKDNQPKAMVKFVLMNTAGHSNRALDEKTTFGEKIVLGLIRQLVPPQRDNELAADYLRVAIGQEDKDLQWTVVRPDTLVNSDQVSDYEIYPSPITSAIFKPGTTSRINVAHFMAQLIADQNLWDKWKGKMPVIYNKGSVESLE